MGGICTTEKSINIQKAIINEADINPSPNQQNNKVTTNEMPISESENAKFNKNVETSDKQNESVLNAVELKGIKDEESKIEEWNRNRVASIQKSECESEQNNQSEDFIVSNVVTL